MVRCTDELGAAFLPDPTGRKKRPYDSADCTAERRTYEATKHRTLHAGHFRLSESLNIPQEELQSKHRTLHAGHFRCAGPLRGIPKHSHCEKACDERSLPQPFRG